MLSHSKDILRAMVEDIKANGLIKSDRYQTINGTARSLSGVAAKAAGHLISMHNMSPAAHTAAEDVRKILGVVPSLDTLNDAHTESEIIAMLEEKIRGTPDT